MSDLRLGDALEVLKTLPENSIDSLVTDPPYGFSFMGKKWDYELPSVDIWKECLRVLKPGAHLLAFGGPRTYHRLVCGIEDAGFEIRDQIQWLFGSGFPKSMNVSIAIDKQKGLMGARGKAFVTAGAGSREDIQETSGWEKDPGHEGISDEAKQWQGWGTALKPANEPICLARKPLSESTVAKNVIRWGTGGINVDGCRIAGRPRGTHGDKNIRTSDVGMDFIEKRKSMPLGEYPIPTGRFPANLILSHSPNCTEEACDMFDCPVKWLDEQSGVLKSGGNTQFPGRGTFPIETVQRAHYKESGGASRFFYVPKVSSRERNQGCEELEEKEARIGDDHPSGQSMSRLDGRPAKLTRNIHPTVKPIKIMSYLCRLVTPPAGVILDPFMGSGSTGIAALQEGFKFIGIEREKEYFEIAEKRIKSVELV